MRREQLLPVAVATLTGCAGEMAVLAAMAFGMTMGAWLIGSERQRRALYEAEGLRRAIASGEHRQLEDHLRSELALADAGEAVSLERQRLARAQLGGLLVAEWRLDEAAGIYGTEDRERLGPHLRALAAFGRHELALLTETATQDRLQAIVSDRDECLRHVPGRFRRDVAAAWHAVEGLCLVRMGRPREAIPLLEEGLRSLEYNPALVVYLYHLGQAYEHIGEGELAVATYDRASEAFPGTRLASEARSRMLALGPGSDAGGGGLFRRMLPEAPERSEAKALEPIEHREQIDDDVEPRKA